MIKKKKTKKSQSSKNTKVPKEKTTTKKTTRKKKALTPKQKIRASILRAEKLNDAAMKDNDLKTALSAQKTLFQLNRIYDGIQSKEKEEKKIIPKKSEFEKQIDIIKSHIEPLKLIDPDYPIQEHCRVAAEIIRQNGLRPA